LPLDGGSTACGGMRGSQVLVTLKPATKEVTGFPGISLTVK
jgi:hypothetical protein